jgi:hypothetical protein
MNQGSARTWVRTRRTVALAALTLLVVGCGATGSPVDTTTAAPTTTTTATTTGAGASATPTSTSVSLPGGLLVTDPPHNAVQPFPAAGSCHARQAANGVLPDPACTPGAVDPHVTDATLESTVCRRGGYTSTVRPPTSVTNSEKRLAQAAYGQSDGPSAYELDHLVPLELGGTPNSAENLWPEPGSSPNAKDKLEGALHDLLCAHRITLTAAQHMIATDWITAYRQILGTPPPS